MDDAKTGKKADELEDLKAWLSDKLDFQLRPRAGDWPVRGPGSKGAARKMEVFVTSCSKTFRASLEEVQRFYDGKHYQGYLKKQESRAAADRAKAEKTGTIYATGGCAKCPYLAKA